MLLEKAKKKHLHRVNLCNCIGHFKRDRRRERDSWQ